MKRIRFFALVAIAAFSLSFSVASASGSGNIFGTFKIRETEQQKQQEAAMRVKESQTTDSLLNSIRVDSLTAAVYRMFPPSFYAPKILGGLNEVQSYTIELPEADYSRYAGVINASGDSIDIISPASLPADLQNPIPEWFRKSLRFQNQIHDAQFKMMVGNPGTVEYADWNLPLPPRLPDEDYSFHGYLSRLNLPEISTDEAILPEIEIKHKNWLHYFNVALQVSQAYVSPNWYQGGNSYVAGLFNFTWNVELNTVYYPRLLFQSSLQYKLAVNSNPKGSLHKYNLSQDLFQYTLKTGLKAFNNHWFYSLNLLFQTQMFNTYPEDSELRSASFLSPGTLNIGLGMTYTLEKSKINLSASISPLAYNLKTCIASDIDHLQFNIKQNRKTRSEIGSSAEANLTWKFSDNISWKSRLFLFTDYGYFLADWENTFNFQINKFLSTQIFLHPRFDSSSENFDRWHHWMFHEILSFGISYTFATPK